MWRAAAVLAAVAAAVGVAAADARAYATPEEASATLSAQLDEYWGGVLASAGRSYVPPAGVVWYADAEPTPCGDTKAHNGTYCPGDRTIYVDRWLFDHFVGERGLRYAVAAVLAHEWGHAVQDQLGLFRPIRRRAGVRPQLEWQADCLAGMWTGWAIGRGLVDDSAAADGLALMVAAGDEPGSPRYFGHGSSAERAAHFLRGYATGSLADCERVLFGQ